MKSKLILSIFSLIFSNVLLSQQIMIQGDTVLCDGDTLRLKVTQNSITGSIDYVWSSSKGGLSGTGEQISMLISVEKFSEQFEVYVKSFYKKDDGTTQVLIDTAQIKIGIAPKLEGNISFFQKENDIFLETPKSNNFSYTWITPNGIKSEGSIVKFTDVKLSDFGKYKLILTNTQTGCSKTYEQEVVIKKEEDKNVFGSIDDTEIPDNLYKEVQRDVPIYESTITGEITSEEYLIAYPGYKFTIIGKIEDDYIIRFWMWKIEDVKKKDSKTKDNVKEDEKINDKHAFTLNYRLNGKKITGNLTDPNTKEPIIGASIMEAGTNKGTVTDFEGNFSFELSSLPANIEVFYTGFQSENYKIDSPSPEVETFKVYTINGIKNLNDKYVIKKRNNDADSDGLNEFKYFRINKDDVASRALSFVPINGKNGFSFTAGTVLIPVKIRNSKDLNKDEKGFEFSKDVAIGPFVGVKKRISKYKPHFIDTGFSVGISSVSITSNNSNPKRTPTVQDLAAFTWSIGTIFEFDNVQIGLFAGKDRINNNFNTANQEGYNWAYQNKWWWSVGFGYALINRPKKINNNQDNTFGKN